MNLLASVVLRIFSSVAVLRCLICGASLLTKRCPLVVFWCPCPLRPCLSLSPVAHPYHLPLCHLLKNFEKIPITVATNTLQLVLKKLYII